MKAVVLSSPNSWEIKEIEIPVPKKGQVLIKMAYAPVNPSDLAFLTGNYGIKKKYPTVPGIEGSGKVVSSGGGFYANYLIGKNVACTANATGNGTWAEYMLTNAAACVPLSSKISLDQASMLFVNPLTALSFINIAKSEKANAIVLTAAYSALSKMVLDLAAKSGIPVIGIVRSFNPSINSNESGFTKLFESNSEIFESDFKSFVSSYQKVVFFDAIGGSDLPTKILSYLPKSSKMISYGRLDQANTPIYSPQDLLFNNHSIHGFWLSNEVANKPFYKSLLDVQKVQQLLKSGFQTKISKTFSIEEIDLAISEYQSNMSKGKVLIDFN
jgi:NADPH:quinone reductase